MVAAETERGTAPGSPGETAVCYLIFRAVVFEAPNKIRFALKSIYRGAINMQDTLKFTLIFARTLQGRYWSHWFFQSQNNVEFGRKRCTQVFRVWEKPPGSPEELEVQRSKARSRARCGVWVPLSVAALNPSEVLGT